MKVQVSKATLQGLLAAIAAKRDAGTLKPGEGREALDRATHDNPNLFVEHTESTRKATGVSETRPRPADYDGSAFKWMQSADASRSPAVNAENRRAAAGFAAKAYEAVVLAEPGEPELDQISGDREQRLLKEFHALHDGLTIMQAIKPGYDPKSSKYWTKYARLGGELVKKVAGEAVSKILTTSGSGTGLDFIPNTMSGSMIPLIKMQLVLANAFEHVTMPTSPWKIPLEGADVTPYLVSETTSDAPDDANNTIGAKTPGTSNLTLTAAKLGLTSFVSAESDEDSIIAMGPFVRMKLSRSMAEGIDTNVLNGDSAGSLDVDSAASTDYRRAWKGLRALTAAGTAGRYSAGQTALTVQKLLNALKLFGKFAQIPADTLIIVSPIGLVHLYGDTNFNQFDKVGQTPALVTGEVTKLYGRPVVVSGAAREDLNGAGYYDGSTTTQMSAVLAHRPSFMLGDRRMVTIKAQEMIRSDRIMFVTTWRGTFLRTQPEVTSGSQLSRNVAQVVAINKNATF